MAGTVVVELTTSVSVDAVVVEDLVKKRVSVDAVSVVVSVVGDVATTLSIAVTVVSKMLADGVTVTVSFAAQSTRPSSPAAMTALRHLLVRQQAADACCSCAKAESAMNPQYSSCWQNERQEQKAQKRMAVHEV